MLKKNVKICDICKVQVAETSCSLCKKDICRNHTRTFVVSSASSDILSFEWRVGIITQLQTGFCFACKEKIQEVIKTKYRNDNSILSDNLANQIELGEALLKIMKNIAILEGL